MGEGMHEHVLLNVLGGISREACDEHTMDRTAKTPVQLAERLAIPASSGAYEPRQVIAHRPGPMR